MLERLIAMTEEGAQLAQALNQDLRLLPTDAALARFQHRDEVVRFKSICDNLDTFLKRYSAELPEALRSRLAHGGHYRPLLLILDDAVQSAPFRSAKWPQCLDMFATVAGKICTDADFIRTFIRSIEPQKAKPSDSTTT